MERLEALNCRELADAAERLETLRRRVLDLMRSLANPDAPHSAVAKVFLRDLKHVLIMRAIRQFRDR
jgi:hypothetical protein